jgi:hypothetical protein
MVLIINKKNRDNIATILKEKLHKKEVKGNLKSHFGKLKRNIDGLAYQKEIRKDEE